MSASFVGVVRLERMGLSGLVWSGLVIHLHQTPSYLSGGV